MKHKYLQDALPFLKEVDKERQRQFEFYFRNAPLWVMDLLQSEELEPGTTFIRENEPADTIFFIGKRQSESYGLSDFRDRIRFHETKRSDRAGWNGSDHGT